MSLEDVQTAVLLDEIGIKATNNNAFHSIIYLLCALPIWLTPLDVHRCFSDTTIVTHYVPLEKYKVYTNNIKEGKRILTQLVFCGATAPMVQCMRFILSWLPVALCQNPSRKRSLLEELQEEEELEQDMTGSCVPIN